MQHVKRSKALPVRPSACLLFFFFSFSLVYVCARLLLLFRVFPSLLCTRFPFFFSFIWTRPNVKVKKKNKLRSVIKRNTRTIIMSKIGPVTRNNIAVRTYRLVRFSVRRGKYLHSRISTTLWKFTGRFPLNSLTRICSRDRK